MKKAYINPEIEIIEIKNQNIITASSEIGTGMNVYDDSYWSDMITLDD